MSGLFSSLAGTLADSGALTAGETAAAFFSSVPFLALVQFLAAGVGTMAFALIFGVPRRFYLYCGLIGGGGWLLYWLLTSLNTGLSATEATFFAAAAVMFLSRLCAVREKCPVTVFLISGIIPLVPGAGIYWAAFYLVTNQLGEGMTSGFAAVKAAAAIVLGIVCIYELPQKIFRFGRKKEDL